MISSPYKKMKNIHFLKNPSTRELSEMDFICFDSPWSEKDYFEMEKSPFFFNWLLQNNEKCLLGILVFNIIFDELEILRLGVHPFSRHVGLADLMLYNLEFFSKERKVGSIFLEVHFANNPAINLYIKNGFKEIGRRRDYYQKPFGDAIILQKLLKKL